MSWRDAQAYIEWLEKETGKPYRLPSEAEWEYAARAGTTTRYAFGDTITPKDANYKENKLGKTTEVGSYPPNAWGLYDMHGNVWEWVEDIWHDNYEGAPMAPRGLKAKDKIPLAAAPSAADPGTIFRGSFVRRTGAGTVPMTPVSISVSALPAH